MYIFTVFTVVFVFHFLSVWDDPRFTDTSQHWGGGSSSQLIKDPASPWKKRVAHKATELWHTEGFEKLCIYVFSSFTFLLYLIFKDQS